jgi:hypothetical protein
MFDVDLRIVRRSQAGLAYLVGILVGLVGLSVILSLYLKALYVTDGQILVFSVKPLVSYLYYAFPPFAWLWPWLPEVNPTPEHVFLSVPSAIGACLMLLGSAIVRYAVVGNAIINGLLIQRRAARMERKTGSYDAPRYGDVIIGQQIVEADQELSRWEKWFWIGIVCPVVATVIAAVITNLTGLTH